MAELLNQSTHKYDSISETDFTAAFNSVSSFDASDVNFEDDLISSLQNARENARARQVFEWEIIRRQTPQIYWRGAA